ncbi:MAG TPA: hypothetical protein VFR17_13620 [Mycobacterium sp.]|nr:hypothetical protein [Mycobacterium sp.]
MVIAHRVGAVVELLLACAAVWGCAATWSRVCSTVAVAPVVDGEPTTTSVVYDPPMLLLTLLLAAAAGVLAVTGSARLRRNRKYPRGVLSAG